MQLSPLNSHFMSHSIVLFCPLMLWHWYQKGHLGICGWWHLRAINSGRWNWNCLHLDSLKVPCEKIISCKFHWKWLSIRYIKIFYLNDLQFRCFHLSKYWGQCWLSWWYLGLGTDNLGGCQDAAVTLLNIISFSLSMWNFCGYRWSVLEGVNIQI